MDWDCSTVQGNCELNLTNQRLCKTWNLWQLWVWPQCKNEKRLNRWMCFVCQILLVVGQTLLGRENWDLLNGWDHFQIEPKQLLTGGRPEEVWPRRKILPIFFVPHFGCSTTANFSWKTPISYTLRYYETSFFTASFHLLNHLRGNSAATRDILIEVLVDEGKARVVSSVTKWVVGSAHTILWNWANY